MKLDDDDDCDGADAPFWAFVVLICICGSAVVWLVATAIRAMV